MKTQQLNTKIPINKQALNLRLMTLSNFYFTTIIHCVIFVLNKVANEGIFLFMKHKICKFASNFK